MCLTGRRGPNKRYLPNKKNGGKPEICTDARKKYIDYDCGWCVECREKRASEWKIRLNKELETQRARGMNAAFVTLTFTDEEIQRLGKDSKSTDSETIAKLAVKRFRERYRKKYKKSPRHWLITELGGKNSERLHIHGILWTPEKYERAEPKTVMSQETYKITKQVRHNGDTCEELTKLWKYGRADCGERCDQQSIGYIVKYMMKPDLVHLGYRPRVLTSPGIGKSYAEDEKNQEIHKYRGKETNTKVRLDNGQKFDMGRYLRGKFYTEKQRDEMWTIALDEGTVYVRGWKMKNTTREQQVQISKTRQFYLQESRKLGYWDIQRKRWPARKATPSADGIPPTEDTGAHSACLNLAEPIYKWKRPAELSKERNDEIEAKNRIVADRIQELAFYSDGENFRRKEAINYDKVWLFENKVLPLQRKLIKTKTQAW